MSGQMKSADIQLIQRIIPHRYPFLLVDRVVDIDGYRSARGLKNPGHPIMPGVTIIEAMAQTAAVMVGCALGLADRDMLVYFMAIETAKFRRMVGPGDVLELDIETRRGKPGGKVWKFAGVARVAGEVAAEAEFTAMMDMPQG
jgi:3-hydroxyacyl-[acyl-carrier-protein] dehydratase